VKELQPRLSKATASREECHPPRIPLKKHRPANLCRVRVEGGGDRCLKESVSEANAKVANEGAHKELCGDRRTAIKELDQQIVPALAA
jgi:hypothetical protein